MDLIRFKISNSPWGDCLAAYSGKGLCSLFIGDNFSDLVDALSARFPESILERSDALPNLAFSDLLLRRYEGPLDLRGTLFQRKVWEIMRSIPPGKTCSYRELAERLGRPKSYRAVAGACAANPIAGIIPCHRVIRSDGGLSGYRWGKQIKEQLLKWEQVHAAKT